MTVDSSLTAGTYRLIVDANGITINGFITLGGGVVK